MTCAFACRDRRTSSANACANTSTFMSDPSAARVASYNVRFRVP
jgi:hypothetical protein